MLVSLDDAAPWVAPSKRVSFAFLRRITPEKGLLGGVMRLVVGGFVFGRFLLAATLMFTLPTIGLALLVAATGLARVEDAGPVIAMILGAALLIAEIVPYFDGRRSMVHRVLRGRPSRAWERLVGGLPAPLSEPPASAPGLTARQRAAFRGYLLQVAFLAVLLGGYALFMATPLARREVVLDSGPARIGDLMVGPVIVIAFVAVFGWRRLRATSATRRLAEDDRRPILLLRPFEKDGKTLPRVAGGGGWFTDSAALGFFDHFTTLENSLADVVDHFGPFIGIGIPGELLQTDGAAREYVSHDIWQDYALSKMADSQQIICLWGISPSFGWEIDQIFSRGYLEKTIFVFPPERSNAFKKIDAEEILREKRLFIERLRITGADDAAIEQTVAAAPSRAGPIALTAEEKVDSAYMTALLIGLLAAAAPDRAAETARATRVPAPQKPRA